MDQAIKNLLTTSYKISLDDAADLILAFIKEPGLSNLAHAEAIGGTVSKEAVRGLDLIYKGYMSWYCRNPEGGNFPKLFMAFEDGEYEIANVPENPRLINLAYSGSTFVYENQPTIQSVKQMLLTDSRPLKEDKKISNQEVSRLINNMPKDGAGINYNEYPCSFFENRGVLNNDMDDLLTEKVVAVRYYFGYDNDPKYKDSNRIRIIMIGVDENGKNILTGESPAIATSEIVQNSWPPPPPPKTFIKIL